MHFILVKDFPAFLPQVVLMTAVEFIFYALEIFLSHRTEQAMMRALEEDQRAIEGVLEGERLRIEESLRAAAVARKAREERHAEEDATDEGYGRGVSLFNRWLVLAGNYVSVRVPSRLFTPPCSSLRCTTRSAGTACRSSRCRSRRVRDNALERDPICILTHGATIVFSAMASGLPLRRRQLIHDRPIEQACSVHAWTLLTIHQ